MGAVGYLDLREVFLLQVGSWLDPAGGETDNKASLQAAMESRAKPPLMLLMAAEVALVLEAQSVELCGGAHVPGVLNWQADVLSGIGQVAVVPSTLPECEVLSGCLPIWHG